MKADRSYLVTAALAGASLYFAYSVSRSWPPALAWTAVGLLALGLVFTLVQLGRRLRRSGGGKDVWHLQRTVLFWVGGLLNTAFVRPEHVGTWRNWVGWGLLAIAVADSVALYRKERAGLPPAPVTRSA